jgi:putative flippase GtrA
MATKAAREGGMAAKFAGVSLIGFVVDAALLHLGVGLGLGAAWARLISLAAAMQVTFTLNGLHTFQCLDRKKIVHQWAGYMAATGFGNFCNYWIFVTLVSLHWPVVSGHMFALAVGSFTAWLINYASTRILVFGKALRDREAAGHAAVCDAGATASPGGTDISAA